MNTVREPKGPNRLRQIEKLMAVARALERMAEDEKNVLQNYALRMLACTYRTKALFIDNMTPQKLLGAQETVRAIGFELERRAGLGDAPTGD